MINTIAAEYICQEMKINYSNRVLTVMSVRHLAGNLVLLELSSNIKKCYKYGQLFKRCL